MKLVLNLSRDLYTLTKSKNLKLNKPDYFSDEIINGNNPNIGDNYIEYEKKIQRLEGSIL